MSATLQDTTAERRFGTVRGPKGLHSWRFTSILTFCLRRWHSTQDLRTRCRFRGSACLITTTSSSREFMKCDTAQYRRTAGERVCVRKAPHDQGGVVVVVLSLKPKRAASKRRCFCSPEQCLHKARVLVLGDSIYVNNFQTRSSDETLCLLEPVLR